MYKRQVGHRGPESIIHPFTPELLAQRGYLYSSSMKDCDWAYLWEKDGQVLPLVELPCDITMDDFTYFYFTFSDPEMCIRDSQGSGVHRRYGYYGSKG